MMYKSVFIRGGRWKVEGGKQGNIVSDLRPSPFNLRPSPFNLRPSTFDLFEIALCVIIILCICASASAQQPAAGQASADQQINDFSLAGYGDKGQKDWELSGKSADIKPDIINLNKVTGNLYDEDEKIKLTADRGNFSKEGGMVHLQDNVIVTTSSGATMTTESLDWDRKNQKVSTDDTVNIQKDNMFVQAEGAQGDPGLKTVQLMKDVKVDIQPQAPDQQKAGGMKEQITITCDGPLEINYDKNFAVLQNNVKVERTDSTIYSDRMDIYFLAGAANDQKPQETNSPGSVLRSSGLFGSKIDKIVARGNVRVVRGDNVSYSEEATYSAADKTILLSGKPKLVIISPEGLPNAPAGN